VCAASDSTGVTHCCKKFFLIRARVFARKFNLDVDGSSVTDTMTHDIGLAMLTHTDETAVLCVKLTDRVVSRYAAVLTEGHDYLVL
jgi:hypothetical protein